MIEAIAVTLQDEIAAHSFDEPTGERLLACPPMLDRANRPYRPGRSPHWIKVKNRKHPAFSRVQDQF